MSNEIKEITATVFHQFRLKWAEVVKSAVNAGITSFLTLIGASIYAQKFPTLHELKVAASAGVLTMLGSVIRYYLNPTTTVIKGQIDPSIKIVPPSTVVAKDQQ